MILRTCLFFIAALFSYSSFSQHIDAPNAVASFQGTMFIFDKSELDGLPPQQAYIASQQTFGKLTDQIITAMVEDYAEKNGISVKEAMIDTFLSTFTVSGEMSEEDKQQFAKKHVLRWLVEKQLYETFGGVVVYRPTNPNMPIEAYLTVLKTYETSGALVFANKEFGTAFWQLFEPPYELTVDKENVNFSQPWWVPIN